MGQLDELEARMSAIESAIGGWEWPDNAESRIRHLEQRVLGAPNSYLNPGATSMVKVSMLKWASEDRSEGYDAIKKYVLDKFGDELDENMTISALVLDLLSAVAAGKEVG